MGGILRHLRDLLAMPPLWRAHRHGGLVVATIAARLEAIELALYRIAKALEARSTRTYEGHTWQPGEVYGHEHIWGDPDTAGYQRCFCGAGR